MILNYLKIAFRNISRHKLFTAINIAGLSISMSLGLLILTVISDLSSYDEFHRNKKDIFRINTLVKYASGRSDLKATCSFPVAGELKNNYPEIKNSVRIQRFFGGMVKAGNKEIELNGYFTEPSFFEVFSFDLSMGSGPEILAEPNSIVLTNSTAKKLFNDEDPMNKLITVGSFGDYIVKGVVNDAPVNSHLQFEMLGSLSSLQQLAKSEGLDTGIDKWDELFKNYVYVQRAQGVSEEKINTGLLQVAQKGNDVIQDKKISLQLQPLEKILPGPDLSSQIGPKMSFLPLVILSAVALLILFSACVNYTNLSLARSLRRAKEIGVRKAIGGSKKQLFIQFLTETFAVSIISLIAAYFVFTVIRPEFLKVVPRASEMFSLQVTPVLILAFIAFAVVTALMAGLLPAAVLSKFNVIQSLKHDTSIKTLGRLNLRKALIVFQFTLSLIFIVGVIVIYRQYKFSVNYDHGFTSENKMIVPLKGIDYTLFKNEFKRNSNVSSITGASGIVGGHEVNNGWVTLPRRIDSIAIDYCKVDENFVKDLGLNLLAGTAFTVSSKQMTDLIVINEQMAVAIGAKYPGDALGRIISINEEEKEVAGVVKDFNYVHLEEPMRNFGLLYEPAAISYAYLGLAGINDDDRLQSLQTSWGRVAGKSVFEGKTMEAFTEETYSFYNNFIKIFGFVAFLAIVIGCLGLVGMSLYAAQLRVKEMGIRKVMGASVVSILVLLSKGFIVLLLIAAAIALPVSYFAFSKILENGVYHIRVGIIELGTGLLFLLLTGGSIIISQTWKTAVSSPVKSLKTE